MCVPGRPAGRRRLEFGLGCSLLAGQRSKDLRNYLITQTSVLPPSLPKASAAAATPLALLLATANKPAAPLPLLPLAPLRPTGLRIKRKPQISKFRPKERKRFRPRARVTKSSVNEAEEEEEENNNDDKQIDLVTKLRTREPASKIQSNKVHTGSRFSVFGRRPRPGLVTPERRRTEEVAVEKEEKKEEKKEKQEEKENTVSHRQPITLQAKLIWVYVDILIIVIILTLIMTHRQVQPPCLLLSWRTSLELPSQWQLVSCCPQGSLNFFVLISAESRSPFLHLGSPSLLATT